MKLSTCLSYGAIAALGFFVAFPPTVAAVKQATGVNIDPTGLFSSVDSVGSLAICNAEGNCSGATKTANYQSHIDPGNGARNQGMFSWQAGGCNSPAECDKRGVERLRNFVPKLQQQAQQKGVKLDTEAVVNGADLVIQAPLAADDFVARLKECQQQGKVGSEAVLCARTKAFINPKTGQLDASGFGNSSNRLAHDQARRMGEISKTLKSASKK
jgi:hypothetical protein